MVATHASHAGDTGSIPGTGSCHLDKSGSQHWGLCIHRESENHVNVGPVSIWDVKEPLRTTSTMPVTILSPVSIWVVKEPLRTTSTMPVIILSPVSIWDVKEPLRTTSTLLVTILSDSCVSPRLGCLELIT